MAPFKTRGIMLDPARLLEKREYYLDLMPWLREWGYNLLHWHFSDDEGCVLQFPSHPELGSEGAFDADEMKAFIATAKKHGLTVLPELESLGHTRCITGHPDYAHLGGQAGKGGGFNSIHPAKKEVRALMRDLLRDVAAIFSCEIIHAGLDEVDMSAIPEFAHLSRAEQWQAFAPYATWIHEEIRQLGRRPAMWGDHLLHSPELLGEIKKDVLIFDWHYNAPFDPSSLKIFADAGFETWGVPASMQWNQKVLPSVGCQFQNLREFTASALHFRDRGCTGMVNAVWTPWRYLSGVIDLPMAFGGHLFSEPQEAADFCEHFAASFYGLDPSDAARCAEAIWALHAIAPMRAEFIRLIQGRCGAALFTREDARRFGQMQTDAARIGRKIRPLVRKATRHADRLHDYVLSAEILQKYGAFGAANRTKGAAGDVSRLLQRCDESWQRTKVGGWKQIPLPYLGTEWLLPTLKTLPDLG